MMNDGRATSSKSFLEALGLLVSTPARARHWAQLWPTNASVEVSKAWTGTVDETPADGVEDTPCSPVSLATRDDSAYKSEVECVPDRRLRRRIGCRARKNINSLHRRIRLIFF
jgi:hypothetical protein